MANRFRPQGAVKEYQHKPLQSQRSIRILELLPAYFDAPLRCRIREIPLDNVPKYEALSYAWGAPERVKQITCESELIRITKNCYFALKHLRKSLSSRFLFVDCICIDQDSPQERNRQVAMMGQVYSNASRVVVWLGGVDRNASNAMNYIRGVARGRGRQDGNRLPSFASRIDLTLVTDLDESRVADLYHFSGKPWFTRVWPVQEMALSKECVMINGSTSISVDELMTFFTRFQNSTFTEERLHRIHLHRQMWRYVQHVRRNQDGRRQKLRNCTRMLLRTQPQHSTEPRDKIFAFHGLLALLGAQLPFPDYSKPVAQVYREAAVAAMQYDNSLCILSFIGGESRIDELPSWVPDWSDSNPISEVATWEENRATGASQISFSISDDNRLLYLRGTIVDTVNQTSVAFPSHQLLNDLLDRPINLAARRLELDVLQQWLNEFGTDPQRTEMTNLFSGLTSNAWARKRKSFSDSSSSFAHYWTKAIECLEQSREADMVDVVKRLLKEDRLSGVKEVVGNIWGFHSVIRKLLDRKVMFRTEGGRLGFASIALEKGDSVALFSGCNLPMIVRRDGLLWRFVSPAFLQDAMRDCGLWPSNEDQLQDFGFV